jgi:putative transcriptional regulator
MPKLTGKAIKAWEAGRDLNAELEASIADIQQGNVTTYTVSALTTAARARLKSGLSQTEFAALLGVSRRTLEQWEQGRREPSGAAKTLIKIAEQCPQVLKEVSNTP